MTLRIIFSLALCAVGVLSAPAAGQGAEAVLRKYGTSTAVPDPTFRGDRSVEYKVLWDVNTAPEKPDQMPAGVARPANFLTMADANGLDRAKVHLALIFSGGAIGSVMTNEAYRAAYGVDNPNIPLLQAMAESGVQLIACGQALAGRKIARDQVLPFVKVATSATFARATLHAQGYATFQP